MEERACCPKRDVRISDSNPTKQNKSKPRNLKGTGKGTGQEGQDWPGGVVHTFSPSAGEAEAGNI